MARYNHAMVMGTMPRDLEDSSDPNIDLLLPKLACPKQKRQPSVPLTTEAMISERALPATSSCSSRPAPRPTHRTRKTR